MRMIPCCERVGTLRSVLDWTPLQFVSKSCPSSTDSSLHWDPRQLPQSLQICACAVPTPYRSAHHLLFHFGATLALEGLQMDEVILQPPMIGELCGLEMIPSAQTSNPFHLDSIGQKLED